MDSRIKEVVIWLLKEAGQATFEMAVNRLVEQMGIRNSSRIQSNVRSLVDDYLQLLILKADEERIGKLCGALSQLRDAHNTTATREYLTNALNIFHTVVNYPEQGMTGDYTNAQLRCIAFLGMATAHTALNDSQQLVAEKMVEAIYADQPMAEQWLGVNVVQNILRNNPNFVPYKSPLPPPSSSLQPQRQLLQKNGLVSYPNLANVYRGTVYNAKLKQGVAAKLVVVQIQDFISGELAYDGISSTLSGSGSFTGKVDRNGHIEFTVTMSWIATLGLTSRAMTCKGSIFPDGSLRGTYVIKGLWRQIGTWYLKPS